MLIIVCKSLYILKIVRNISLNLSRTHSENFTAKFKRLSLQAMCVIILDARYELERINFNGLNKYKKRFYIIGFFQSLDVNI